MADTKLLMFTPAFRHPLIFALATFTTLAAWAEDEIDVGSTSNSTLTVNIAFTPPAQLNVSVYPGIAGYATGAMGFHSVQFNDPINDVFLLSTAADFRFVLLAKDPGMEVWNDTGSGFMQVGDSFYIGPPPFDTHPIWNLVGGVPGTNYTLTLKIHDVNGVYPDSDPFVLSFTAVPPQLVLTQPDPTHATISWQTNAPGWLLESGTPWIGWSAVTNVPAVSAQLFQLTFPVDASQQLFRLRVRTGP